jgi:hypothetical protein
MGAGNGTPALRGLGFIKALDPGLRRDDELIRPRDDELIRPLMVTELFQPF